jgi:hypothetical protein
MVVIPNVVFLVLDSPTIFLTFFTSLWWRPGAISTGIDLLYLTLQVVCNILHARAVTQSFFVSMFVHSPRVTAIASTSKLAVNYFLSI